MDETSKLTKHYLRRKYVYDAIEFDPEDAESTPVDEHSTLNGIEVVWKTFHILNSNALARSTVPQCLENNRLGSALVYCLDSKVKGALIPLRIVGSFFEFIPARLGRNAALDDAVSCICAIYCGNPATPYNMHKEVCKSYVKALSSLRACLDDDAVRMESETLCASILLQMCEVRLFYVLNLRRWLTETPCLARCQYRHRGMEPACSWDCLSSLLAGCPEIYERLRSRAAGVPANLCRMYCI